MRPRIFHELSRHLAELLEKGIRGGSGENPIAILLCHPLDAFSDGREPSESGVASEEAATGVLYLYRVSPAPQFRQGGLFLEEDRVPGGVGRMRKAGPWARLRYAFLVVGGTQADELGVLSAALRLFHEKPFVELEQLGDATAFEDPNFTFDFLPVTLLDEPGTWREIGLEEHRLSLSFEVCVPLPSGPAKRVEPIVERDLDLKPVKASGENGV